MGIDPEFIRKLLFSLYFCPLSLPPFYIYTNHWTMKLFTKNMYIVCKYIGGLVSSSMVKTLT